jgi:cell division protein FtsB
MSDMPEINLDDVNTDKHEIVYLRAHQHQALMKANRFLLMLVLALMAAVFLLGFILLPKQNLLTEIQKHQAISTAYATQNPVLSAEISALKGQLFGLLSGSIDSKLRALEENIKKGSVADSLETIQDLKGDVKILTTYSVDSPAKVEGAAVNQVLIKELNDIKDLVYLTFVSCGLMIAAIAGVWLRNRHRLTHQRSQQAYLSKQD